MYVKVNAACIDEIKRRRNNLMDYLNMLLELYI